MIYKTSMSWWREDLRLREDSPKVLLEAHFDPIGPTEMKEKHPVGK